VQQLVYANSVVVRSLTKCGTWPWLPALLRDPKCPNPTMDGYVVEGTTGHRDNDKTELQRLYYSTIDSVLGEMDQRFSECNSQLAKSLAALNPESDTFLDAKAVKHIMDLSGSPVIEAEYEVAKQFFSMQKQSQPIEGDWTIQHILSNYHMHLKAMPSVMTAFKHALTFGASTAMRKNSFSTLRNVFSDHRRAMLHKRKAQLVQLAFQIKSNQVLFI